MELAVLDDHRSDPGFLLLRLGHAGKTAATPDRRRFIHDSSAKSRQSGLSSTLPGPSLTLGFPESASKEKGECGGSGSEETEKLLTRGSDEEEDGSRKKLRLSKQQSALLEERFKEHSNLSPKQKLALAQQLRLRPRQVEVWFQNRRARSKLKKTEADCEFLRRRCENLKGENRRLYREIQELKALKLVAARATSLYLRHPSAKLMICPSCEPGKANKASKAVDIFAGEAGGGDK